MFPITALFCTGLLAQTAQILITRELMVVVEGNEHVIGFLLATWLLWGAAGSAAAGFFVNRCNRNGIKSDRQGYGTMGAWALWLAAVSLTPALIATRLARPLFDAPIGTPLPFTDTLLAALVAPAIPCMAIGAAFAFLVSDRKRLTTGFGFGMESLGALAAGCAFVMFLGHVFPPLALSLCITLLTVIVITPTVAKRTRDSSPSRHSGTLRPLLALVIMALTAGICVTHLVRPTRLDRVTEQLRWSSLLPSHTLLDTAETPYGRYSALALDNQVSIFHDGTPHQTLPDPEAGMLLVHTALLQLDGPPESILIIGSVTEPATAHALEHLDHTARIDRVEQDGHYQNWIADVQQTGLQGAASAKDDRVHLHTADPGQYLTHHGGQYDVVILDMPDPATIGLDRYYQQRLIRQAADAIRDEGVFCVSISGEAHYLSEPFRARNALVYATVRSVFGACVLASNGDPTVLLARKSNLKDTGLPTLNTDTLITRLGTMPNECLPYLAFLLGDPWPASRVQTVNNELAAGPSGQPDHVASQDSDSAYNTLALTHDDFVIPPLDPQAHINTADRPAAYQAHLLATLAKYDPASLAAATRLPGGTLCLITGFWLILLVTLGLSVRRTAAQTTVTPRMPAYTGLAAAGFAALGLQMITLMWYQHCLGSLYVDLAILSGCYMAGLALGSLSASQVHNRHRLIMVVSIGILICKAIILWLACTRLDPGAGVSVLAIAVSVMGGLALGAHFTAWDSLSAQQQRSGGQAQDLPCGIGGLGYAADLFGASLAGLCIAAVIIPAYGYSIGLACCVAYLLIMGMAVPVGKLQGARA